MRNFNNIAYEALVKDLLNDAFYLENISTRGRISTIRQYTEVIIRRILDLPVNADVTLGNFKIREALTKKTNNNRFLLDSIESIRRVGNDCTHTKKIGVVVESDINSAVDSLFNVYSFLLIDYFQRYEFGSNLEVASSFSLLPPIIRYIVLNYLNEKFPDNIMIIDKLTLAILKAYSKEDAIEWINKRSEALRITPSVTEEGEQSLVNQLGEFVASIIVSQSPNMYDLCNKNIELVGNAIEQTGKLYNDFESAIDHYRERGIVNGESTDIEEFNSIMEFLYLGRKSSVEKLEN